MRIKEGKKAPNFKLESTSLKKFELSKIKHGLIKRSFLDRVVQKTINMAN